MKTLTDFMPGMVGYWTRDLRSTFANREYLNWFGKSAEEMSGIHLQDLLGEELFLKNKPYILAALAGEVQTFERTLTKARGETRETLAHYIPHSEDNEVLGFFVLVIDITERKRLEAALVSIAEERQRSIGQELHDNLGQQIAAINYQSCALERMLITADNKDLANIAASIANQAQNAVVQCKQLAQGLLPFELESNGLTHALQTLSSTISTTYGVECKYVSDKEISITKEPLALNLYRIAQEAINNAIRHGRARHIKVLLDLKNGLLRLSIFDDGRGFNEVDATNLTTSGMGIKIMRYRASQIGASLSFIPRAEGGAEVRVEMQL